MGQDVENPILSYTEKEPKVVAYCVACSWALTEQDNLMELEDNDYVCDEACVIDYYNIRTVRGCDI